MTAPEAATPADAGETRETGPGLAIERAERWLRAGEPLLAYNEIQLGLDSWPDNLRLRQLQGLALARSGDTQRAHAVLSRLRDEGVRDGETLGLLARTMKDLGLGIGDPDRRRETLQAALELYAEGYASSRRRGAIGEAYYTGINAATLALLCGDPARAGQLAGEVTTLCEGRLEEGADPGEHYWLEATLGEAALIQGEHARAAGHYRAAARAAGARYGDIASTRKQARLLLATRGESAQWLEQTLAVPPVLLFTGHMIDHPGRPAPRFPPQLEDEVAARIGERLDAVGPLAAFGSAACGADILCLEAMLERGGEIHVTLPFPPAEFRAVSVDFAPGGRWGKRFERVLEAASSLTVTSEHRASGSDSSFDYANLVLTGAGVLRAQVLDTRAVGLAVWDGEPGDGVGGTGSLVDAWRARGIPVDVVDTRALLGEDRVASGPEAAGAGAPVASPPPTRYAGGFTHDIKAMLFADAVGYSKLTEDQVALFIERFLGAVARLVAESPAPPVHKETAGDGLYMVFDRVEDAGRFGLALAELVEDTDWAAMGLPESMNMRVALHCGPVFCGLDPVTGHAIYTGPHTSRTARIEPITPPGQVYASSAFAAVATAAGADGMAFRYVGRTRLAKKYGELPLFHLRRAAPGR